MRVTTILYVYPPHATIGMSSNASPDCWIVECETQQAPIGEDARVQLGDLMPAVKRSYLDVVTGHWTVELVPYQVNPPESMRPHCDGRYRAAWISGGEYDDDPIEEVLTAAGMVRRP